MSARISHYSYRGWVVCPQNKKSVLSSRFLQGDHMERCSSQVSCTLQQKRNYIIGQHTPEKKGQDFQGAVAKHSRQETQFQNQQSLELASSSSRVLHDPTEDDSKRGRKSSLLITTSATSALKRKQSEQMSKVAASRSVPLPGREDLTGEFGIQEFWQGSYMDPDILSEEKIANAVSGDPWPACLLRLKSFEDLHKLWYVCLKEKNLLLSERHYHRQLQVKWKNQGRLKKVKLSMKRILTVLARREIHEQALRAKEILKAQQEREILETRRFHLEEQQKTLRYKVQRMKNDESVAKSAWRATIEKNDEELQALQDKLQPLRKATMALLIPDWRYMRKYTDLPGTIAWKKQWIRALDETKKRPFRFY